LEISHGNPFYVITIIYVRRYAILMGDVYDEKWLISRYISSIHDY